MGILNLLTEKMGLILGVLIIKEVLEELLPGFEGTIVEYEGCNCEEDCVRLHDAIDKVIMDTDEVIDVLSNRCNSQRAEIREEYKNLYGEDLYDVCKRIRRDDLRHVVKGMLLTPVEYDCKCLRKAMRGIGSSDDDVLIEILCARPNGYIEELKEKYAEMYEKDLEEDIADNTRREFEHFMIALVQAARDEGIDAIADESVFTRIMARRSWMQIRRVAAHYEEIAGHPLTEAIDSECHGETRRAYKAVVRMATDPCFYFARNIYKAMRGLGTDDDCLVRNIIFTSEWGLATIKERYEEENGSTIADDIDSECRGDYKDILLAIVK